MWSENSEDPYEEPLQYRPDTYTRTIPEAYPKSKLFQEFLALTMRARLDRPDPFFIAADVGSVMAEEGVHFADLANGLHVPQAYMLAVKRGWHRLGLRVLALVSEALNVPISAFILNAAGAPRMDVRRYHAYRIVEPKVTILGGP